MLARNPFEFLDTFKLALVRPFILEGMAPNYLCRPENASRFAAGQPNISVCTASNPSE
jgi:hypothetical protein